MRSDGPAPMKRYGHCIATAAFSVKPLLQAPDISGTGPKATVGWGAAGSMVPLWNGVAKFDRSSTASWTAPGVGQNPELLTSTA